MTSAPDLFCLRLILDDAVEVRADGGECFISPNRCAREFRLAPKLEDLSRIARTSLSFAATTELSVDHLDYLRRRHEPNDRVDDCPEGRRGACA